MQRCVNRNELTNDTGGTDTAPHKTKTSNVKQAKKRKHEEHGETACHPTHSICPSSNQTLPLPPNIHICTHKHTRAHKCPRSRKCTHVPRHTKMSPIPAHIHTHTHIHPDLFTNGQIRRTRAMSKMQIATPKTTRIRRRKRRRTRRQRSRRR